jgi:hypothetical protein
MRFKRSGTGILLGAILLLGSPGMIRAAEPPPWLPRYDLDMQVDVAGHEVRVHERVTWTNPQAKPTSEIVFNAHSHYQVAGYGESFFAAKMLEILRMPTDEVVEPRGSQPPLEMQQITLDGSNLAYYFKSPYPTVEDQRPFPAKLSPPPDAFGTALVVPLPRPVASGESITLELTFRFRLPHKQGRWGQWRGITYLAQWLPVVAVYDQDGWQPTPFVPWHQPYFNEAGIYTARVILPSDQQIACSAVIQESKDLGDGRKQVDFQPVCVRDFAFFCSARFQEYVGSAGGVQVRCLALPEHEYYARNLVRWACDAIPVYNQWFGPYPNPQFTIVESFFGWNGNECGGLVMIDERVFAMPHLAGNFVEYLISHELCHQWWYNVVGTNGYCETWMDEGIVTYLSHKLIDRKQGRNSTLLTYPSGLEWLPNIYRDNYRNVSLLGTLGRGENGPTVQAMPRFSHLGNLLSLTYDRGSKITGMIEERLGSEAAFLDFMHMIYAKYYFRILRVRDFQRELIAYTGRSDWEQFFQHWLWGACMCDWAVEKVTLEPLRSELPGEVAPVSFLDALHGRKRDQQAACKATILLSQKADCSEPTILGICLDGGDGYQIRLPIDPNAPTMQLDNPPARVDVLSQNCVRVEVVLPCPPTQIAVDPDAILVDPNRNNNYWKTRVRFRFAPVYTPLEETSFCNDYDRWNVDFGLGFSGPSYADEWYQRSYVVGLRAAVTRSEFFDGGGYFGYRTGDGSVVAGVDGLWDHWPWSHTQVGFNYEHRLATLSTDSSDYQGDRGSVFGRYVFMYNSSLYLPPAIFVEAFSAVQNHALLPDRQQIPDTNHFNQQTDLGLHFHADFRVPYWDPEHGVLFDLASTNGIPIFGEHESFNRVDAQLSVAEALPEWTGPLSQTKVAARIFGGSGWPNNGEYYTMGGGNLFRGFDTQERQGSSVWVASVEWRVPVIQRVNWDCCDHVAGIRNVYLAPFYDVGDVYVNGHETGPIAHALGCGLRVDVALLSIIERAILRFDVAKTLNSSAPLQFWFGIEHPF